MTVKDLIEKLSVLPRDAIVRIYEKEGLYSLQAEYIYTRARDKAIMIVGVKAL